MSLTITQVVIGSETDRRLTLGNSQLAATLNIGVSWTTLRVGCRVAWDDFGATLTGTPRFYLGVLASPATGLTNGPLTTATSHYIGIRSNAASWTRTIGASSHYGWVSAGAYCKKVGSTATVGAGGLSAGVYNSILPASNRTAFIVELDKTSSILTKVTMIVHTDSANSTGDVSPAQLKVAMEQATMAGAESILDTVTGQAYSGGSASSNIATDEAADGYWNSICVAWNQSAPLCYVSEMFFAKVA